MRRPANSNWLRYTIPCATIHETYKRIFSRVLSKWRTKPRPQCRLRGANDETAPTASTEEISYHAVEKEGVVTAIWEMQGRTHSHDCSRSRQGRTSSGSTPPNITTRPPRTQRKPPRHNSIQISVQNSVAGNVPPFCCQLDNWFSISPRTNASRLSTS